MNDDEYLRSDLATMSADFSRRLREQFDAITAQSQAAMEVIAGQIRAAMDTRSQLAANAVRANLPKIDWTNFYGRCRGASGHLAQAGWTLPMEMSLPELLEIAVQDDATLDASLVEHYTRDDFAVLRRVRKELLSRPGLSQWQVLLTDCFDVFESGRHVITIPALFSIMEGVVASAGNSLRKKKAGPKFLVDICKAKAGAVEDGIPRVMCDSLGIFMGKLFQDAPFDQSRPVLMNRNWIMHGRDSSNWTIADALRLFNALQTIDSLLEE